MRIMPQSCRARFSRRDFEFIAAVLGDNQPSREDPLLRLLKDAPSLDLLLDDPKLLDAVIAMHQTVNISANLYFYILVRHALQKFGIDHREMADYVAGTLAEFSKGNPFDPGANDQMKPEGMPYHIDFIEAINSASPYDRFYLHVRCGDQFLVLTGLFPDFIEHRKKRRGAPGVRYYEGVARESYRSAGVHPLADEFTLCEIYELLSDQFRKTRRALNHMAREYMFIG